MIEIYHNKKLYQIQKEKLIFIIEKLTDKKVDERKIKKHLKRLNLYNDDFLKNVNLL